MQKAEFFEQKFIGNILKSQQQSRANSYQSPQRYSEAALPRLRLNKLFHQSPTCLERIKQKNSIIVSKNNPSRYFTQQNCANSLNSLFKMKKISKGNNIYGNTILNVQEQSVLKGREKEEINKDIEHSIHYVQAIKKNKPLLSLQKRNKGSQNKNNNSIVFDIRGLVNKLNSSSNSQQKRLSTQPSSTRKKKMSPIGLFSYLQRESMGKNRDSIGFEQINKYAMSPKNKGFQKLLMEKSRKYLKNQTVHNGNLEEQQVYKLIQDESRNIIKQQMQKKQKIYKKQFKKRINVPYFTYLSLSPKQKQSINSYLQAKSFQ